MVRKVVLITGANGGIGRAVSERFASEGYALALCVRQQREEFDAFVESLRSQYSAEVLVSYFDITNERDTAEAVRGIWKEMRQIDVLVNNAGVEHGGLFQMTSIAEMKRIMDTNYFSAVRLSQLVVRIMQRNGSGGAIVNVSSVAGLDLDIGNCAYGVSKAALAAFTKTAAKELAPQGIRMNAVAPGLTDTRMAAQMKHDNGKNMIEQTAMKRLAQPREIADVVFFLASEQASFITGQVIRVDGGM